MRGGKRENAGRKPCTDSRTVRWPIRWTEDEQAAIAAAAELAGVTPTDYGRAAILSQIDRDMA